MKHDTRWSYMGKLPSQGDFININFEQQLNEQWFQWCQSGLAVSREQLHDTWLEYWLTAPIWLFTTEPGVLGKTPYVGAMIPSMDKIGRYFPFLALRPFNGNPWQLINDQSWVEDLESIMVSALNDDWEQMEWEDSLNHHPMPDCQQQTLIGLDSTKNLSFNNNITSDMLAHSALLNSGKNMYWMCRGSAHVPPSFLATAGLPQAGQFSSLLKATWETFDWDTLYTKNNLNNDIDSNIEPTSMDA